MAPAELQQLTAALTVLSEECWSVYCEPVLPDCLAGSVDRRRDLGRVAGVIEVMESTRTDQQVSSGGSPLINHARLVGEICHRLNDPSLTSTVTGDVQAEAEAVVAADRGALGGAGGRDRQATPLSYPVHPGTGEQGVADVGRQPARVRELLCRRCAMELPFLPDPHLTATPPPACPASPTSETESRLTRLALRGLRLSDGIRRVRTGRT